MKSMKLMRLKLLKLCQQNESDPDTYRYLFQLYKQTFREHSKLLNWVEQNNQTMPKYSKSVVKEKDFVNICYKAIEDMSSEVWKNGEFNHVLFTKIVEETWDKRFTRVKEPLSAIDERTEGSAQRFDGDDDSHQDNSLSNSFTPREESPQNKNSTQDKEKRLSIQNHFHEAPETVNEVSQSKEQTELEGEDEDEEKEAIVPKKNESSKRHKSGNQSRNFGRGNPQSDDDEEFFSQNSDFEDPINSKRRISNKFDHSKNSLNGGFNMSDFEDVNQSSVSQKRRSSSSAKNQSKEIDPFASVHGLSNASHNKSGSFSHNFGKNSKDFGSGGFEFEDKFNSYDMNDNKDDAFAQFADPNFETSDKEQAFANFGDFNDGFKQKSEQNSPTRDQYVSQGKFKIGVNQEKQNADPSSEEEQKDQSSEERHESHLNRSVEDLHDAKKRTSEYENIQKQSSMKSDNQVHRPNSQSHSKINQSDANLSSRSKKSTQIAVTGHISQRGAKLDNINSQDANFPPYQSQDTQTKKSTDNHQLSMALAKIENMQVQIEMLNQTNAELQAQLHNTSQAAIKAEEFEE